MSSTRTGRYARRLALGVAAGSVILLTGAAGQAQEGNIFDMLFGAPRPAPVQVQPSYAPLRTNYREKRRVRREQAARWQRANTRYVALPRADENAITGKQPVDQKAILDDPKGVLLKDQTLRAGDIVVMPSGPKVFTGAQAKTHRMSEFEDVKHSRFLDKKTRGQLVAMMVPIGAMTPEQARKTMSVKLKLAPPDEVQAVEAANSVADAKSEPSAPRVIAPWTSAQP